MLALIASMTSLIERKSLSRDRLGERLDRVDGFPALRPERFQRAEAHLVGHLAAILDPIAEIDMAPAGLAAMRDEPQHEIGTKAALGHVGGEEAVDGGESVLGEVEQAAADQGALGVAQLDEARL